jgi:AraC-like DNA-binding protein
MPKLHQVAIPSLAGTLLEGAVTWLAALEDSEPPTTYRPESVGDTLRMLFTFRGSARLETAVGSVPLMMGSLVLLAPGWAYRQRINTEIWAHRSILLRGPWADRLVRSCTAGVLVLERPAPTVRNWMSEAVEHTLARHPSWDAIVAARLALVIEALTERSESDLVGLLVRAIAAEPDRAWRVADLAALSGLGLSGFAHRFRRETGVSPARWLLQHRIDRACKLLATHPPGAVAELLGFANPYHFSRAFSRICGESPSLHRQRLARTVV